MARSQPRPRANSLQSVKFTWESVTVTLWALFLALSLSVWLSVQAVTRVTSGLLLFYQRCRQKKVARASERERRMREIELLVTAWFLVGWWKNSQGKRVVLSCTARRGRERTVRESTRKEERERASYRRLKACDVKQFNGVLEPRQREREGERKSEEKENKGMCRKEEREREKGSKWSLHVCPVLNVLLEVLTWILNPFLQCFL